MLCCELSINVIQCLKYNVVPNKCSCSAHALQASRFCMLPNLWLQGGNLGQGPSRTCLYIGTVHAATNSLEPG